jgi:hypothetical protein
LQAAPGGHRSGNGERESREKFVLFIDLLGFTALVEKSGRSLSSLRPVFQSADWVDTITRYRLAPNKDSLEYRFEMFHRFIEKLRNKIRREAGAVLICFSDSAFVAVDRVDLALSCAREIHYNCLHANVPVRSGLAKGSFRLLRFVSESSDGVSNHTSQFLGTGIVRAYEAHRGNGMRAFLHSNLASSIRPWLGREILRADETNRAIGFEINYLNADQRIPFIGGMVGDPAVHDLIFFERLSEMRKSASLEALRHYKATFDALNRMRTARGRPVAPVRRPKNGYWRMKAET